LRVIIVQKIQDINIFMWPFFFRFTTIGEKAAMIYTITLNPSLDRTIEVEELIYDDVNHVVEERRVAGGKGIDVSRVVKELGGKSIALGFAGGYNGLELEGNLVNEGVICNFTRVNDETKTNMVLYQRKKNVQTLLSKKGPRLLPLEVATFFNKVKETPMGSWVVISGNIPDGTNENFFAQLIITLRDRNVKVILDTDGEPLRSGVKAGPYLIKPNIHEFGRLVEKNVVEIEDIVEESRPFLDNVEYVVVSMGARGVLGVSRDGAYHVSPPKVKVRSSIGAGDSLVAGLVFVLSEGGSFEEALCVGVACGTASTLNPGSDLCTKEDVAATKKDVIVKKI
jgi:6-phosphofructokinase 2